MQIKTLLPPNVIGIFGGGQIGRMTAQAAHSLGYQVAIFDPDQLSPAAAISQQHMQADYLDQAALAKFSHSCAAITTEFENIPAKALEYVRQFCQISPTPQALAIAQNRFNEKNFFTQHNIPCAPFTSINSLADSANCPDSLFPAILKTSQFGYDGKGQLQLQHKDQLTAAWQQLQQQSCILEKMLALKAEYSIAIARSFSGKIVNLPIQRNQHHQGILAATEVAADLLTANLTNQLISYAQQIAIALNYVGVLCIEFFVLEDNSLLANEIAPRPHNSAHHSIDSCNLSQFELQVRTATNMPIWQPTLHSPCVMLNLLGDLWFKDNSSKPQTPDFSKVLAVEGAHLHLYAKKHPKLARKMGHITVTAASLAQAQQRAQIIIDYFNLPVSFN